MKNTTIFILVGILIIGGAWFVFSDKSNNTDNNPVNGDVVISDVDTQKITLGMKNYNYYPNTITVKEGKPVEITLDKSVVGCYRSFVIKDLGVSESSRTPEDKIVFTPTKKGSFRYQCGMGMGTGTIVVE